MANHEQMQEVTRLLSALVAKFEQREARMQATVDQQLQVLQSEVSQLHQRVGSIVSGAQARITEEARAAMGPVAAEYGRAVDTTSAQLRRASRTVWAWYGGLAGLGLLLAVIGWSVLGYYQRELARTRDELGRYENAVPVVQAFYASDAIVCGERICVNVEANAQRHGVGGKYAPARPRRQR